MKLTVVMALYVIIIQYYNHYGPIVQMSQPKIAVLILQ